MKKTKLLVLTTLAFLAATTSVYAKLPANTVVIGNQAFDVSYLFDSSHIDEVNKALNPSTGPITNIFFIDSNQNVKDIFNPTITKSESDILSNNDNIIYKSNSYPSSGITYKFSNSEYSYYDKPVAKFSVAASSFNGGYVVTITYNDFKDSDDTNSKLGTDAKYIQIKGLDPFAIGTSKTVEYFTSSKSIPISVLDGTSSTAKTIANGQIDLSSVKLGQSTDITSEFFKPLGDVTALDTPSGNSQNSGEVALVGSSIYYINSSDRGTLYKCDVNGANNKEVSEDKVKYLCTDGTNVYYSNLSDNGKLYTVKSDGTRSKITDYAVSCVTVSNDTSNTKVYFINSSDNKVYSYDGSSASKIDDISAKILNIIGATPKIYYTNINDSNKLYEYSGTSSLAANVPSESLKQFVGNDSTKLISCTLNGDVYNGTNKINLILYNSYTKTSKLDKAASINVIGDYIYYKSLSDSKLYRVNVNGGNAELIVPSPVDNIYVINSQTLYYSQSGKISRLDIGMDKGTGKTTVVITSPQKEVQKKIIKVTDLADLAGNKVLTTNDTLDVTFADNTHGPVHVYWDLNKPIYNSDETIYTGVLPGGMTVQYHYSESSNSPTSDSINHPIISNIINNPGSKDTVIVSGGDLLTGDTVKLYNDASSGLPLGQGIVGSDGKATIINLNIIPGTSLYISRTEKGKKESTDREQIRDTSNNTILNSPVISSVADNDSIYNNADGRDLSIKVDKSSISSVFTKKYAYIIPRGMAFNLNSASSLKAYDLNDTNLWTNITDTNYVCYTGTNAIVTDSLGRILNTGLYDIYVVGETANGDKYSSDTKGVSINAENPAATVIPTVIGDRFKAQGALSDVSVKLLVRTAAGSIISSIGQNYTVTVQRNGLSNTDYNFDQTNNTINLHKDYVNKLSVGNNEFTVMLTDANGKTVSSKFIVVVNEATSFQLAVDNSIFTKGYAPNNGVNIIVTGYDKNGNKIDSAMQTNLIVTVYVNGTAITNFTANKNVVTLNESYLNTLATGNAVIKIENQDLGLSETATLNVVDSQAELTPVIDNFQSFTVGHAANDINVKLNAKDSTGVNATINSIESIDYDGTKIVNNSNNIPFYSLSSNNLTLNKNLLNELVCGNNLLTINAKTSAGSTISGNININVDSAARLELKLKDAGKDSFVKASSQDLHYDVAKYDDNNYIIDKSSVDLSNIKLTKGSYILQKGIDYDVDNTNKVVTLRKSYLDKLISGDTTINVQLLGLSENIILHVNDGAPVVLSATSDLNSFAHGGAPDSGMNITVNGITVSQTSDIKVKIQYNNGTPTIINPKNSNNVDNYTVNSSGKVTINKGYLDSLSAKVSPYTIVISDASETKSASLTLNVTSVASFIPDTASFSFVQGSATDTSINISETDSDGASVATADLTNEVVTAVTVNTLGDKGTSITLKAGNDYDISGNTINIHSGFLNALQKGTTTLNISRDGIVNPAVVTFTVN